MFKDLFLKTSYSTYESDIAEEFYIPVLKESVQYDRASAYFSAKALASYAKGIEHFQKSSYKYRLVVSTEISEDDFEAIKKGYELREELKLEILQSLDETLTCTEKGYLANLAFLISAEVVDIKMAFTKKGIFHDKFGILKDREGNIICFRGSNNETDAAFHANYESFDITCSWQASSFDYQKITKSVEDFSALWENKKENVQVCAIDKVIQEKILSYNKGKIIYEPCLLEENCLILDYTDEKLKLHIKIKNLYIQGTRLYKLRLRRYILRDSLLSNLIEFNENLTYIDYKKIINHIENDSQKEGYIFYITSRLKKYIQDRELYIHERSRMGLAIKQQQKDLLSEFEKYEKVVNIELERKLRKKQMWDSFFMYTMRKSSNFSVPGSGKTASVLGVYAFLESIKEVDKIVMIGPKNSFISWIDEFKNCFGAKKKLKVFNIQDYTLLNDKKVKLKYTSGNKNLLLFNYESLNSIMNEVKRIIDNKTLLVFDEAHRIKSISGTYAKNALEVSMNSKFTIVLTGTPIPNTYLDIRNMLEILYRDEYDEVFGFSEQMLKNPSESEIEEINKKIQPFFCRTTKHQLDVPIASPDIIIKAQASYEENRIFHILNLKYQKNKLALIIRLLQLESNPRMLLKAIDENREDFSEILDISGAIEDIDFKDFANEIHDLVDAIDNTQKFSTCIDEVIKLYSQKKTVIIWCLFVDSITRLSKELKSKGLRVCEVFGAKSNEERTDIITDFKNGKYDVLITNPHTLAESVSLHFCCHDAIYFEYSYNLVHLLQSKDRIHRLGLPEGQYTQYQFIQTEFQTEDERPYSLDEKIYLRLVEKERTMINAIENNILEPVYTTEDDLEKIFGDLRL